MHTRNRLQTLRERLAPRRDSLLRHPIYDHIDRLERLHLFMQYHVFAVWDFMSLLKALQRGICCTEIPWLPPENATAARFVNEIVLGEETDEDGRGGYASHFEMYRRAMRQCGASTGQVDGFVDRLREGAPVESALEASAAPAEVREFVEQTFSVIRGGNLCAIASAFTFGREDLLPDVFQQIVAELQATQGAGLDDFRFYLHRHIELDGDEHGPMAERMIESLCGQDETRWRVAEEAAVAALRARCNLWDAAHERMLETLAPSS